MHDLAKLLHDDAIERQAEILRRQLNLWVGACLADGQIVWLGANQCVDKPFCEKCQNQACMRIYHAWFEKHAQQPASSNFMVCQAGLRGIAVPLFLQGQCQALIFASGFLFEDDDLPTPAAIHEEQLTLTRRESKIVLEMLTEMALQIQDASANKENSGASKGFDSNQDDIIAQSQAMQAVLNRLDAIAHSDGSVLLIGPEGAGKKFVASAIHRQSARKNAPFVVVHCKEFPDEQLESELSGYRRGAFIGAMADKIGLLDIADKGTLFFDNIDTLTPSMQLKLACILKNRAYQPNGDPMQHAFDIRIMASSTGSLAPLTADGTFARDLYYLLNLFEIEMPALAQRREDIAPLAQCLMAKACAKLDLPQKQLSSEVLDLFDHYGWPGNVRELENEIDRILAQPVHDNLITAEHVSDRIRHVTDVKREVVDVLSKTHHAPELSEGFSLLPGQNLQDALEDIERRMITLALRQTAGNRTKTAEILGISRRNLIRKIENLHIDG